MTLLHERALLFCGLFIAGCSLFAVLLDRSLTKEVEGVQRVSENCVGDSVAAQIIALHKKARKTPFPFTSFQSVGRLEEGQEHSVLRFFRDRNDRFCYEVIKTQNGWVSNTLWGLNGAQAWSQEYAPEIRGSTSIPVQESAYKRVHAMLWSPINCDYFAAEHFSYMGKKNLAESDCFVLKDMRSESVPVVYYLDPKSFLIRAYKTMDFYGGRYFESLCYIKKYQKIKGVWFPVHFEYYADNKKYRSVQWDDIYLNQDLDPALFRPRSKGLP